MVNQLRLAFDRFGWDFHCPQRPILPPIEGNFRVASGIKGQEIPVKLNRVLV